MKRLILPLLLGLIGLGAGVGAGLHLKPAEEDTAEAQTADSEDVDASTEFARLNNQFIVPVMREDRVAALVVLSLTLEVDTGATETVFAHEPRLRDRFLRVLFDHANSGGFDAGFTRTEKMSVLRTALSEVADRILGELVHDVLIVDIVRQEV